MPPAVRVRTNLCSVQCGIAYLVPCPAGLAATEAQDIHGDPLRLAMLEEECRLQILGNAFLKIESNLEKAEAEPRSCLS
jgi:hypothetical protein